MSASDGFKTMFNREVSRMRTRIGRAFAAALCALCISAEVHITRLEVAN